MSHSTVLVIGPDPEKQLEPFNEELEVPVYTSETREQLIARSRELVELARTTWYQQYLADPDGYIRKSRNPAHIRYILSGEFEAKLSWTDEQHYADAIKFLSPDELDENGGALSTYNPRSKWDWYALGGRWNGGITTKSGDEVNVARKGDIDLDVTTSFAILKDDVWHEKGSMGWFGIVSDEKDDWRQTWREIMDSVPDDALVSLYDVHI